MVEPAILQRFRLQKVDHSSVTNVQTCIKWSNLNVMKVLGYRITCTEHGIWFQCRMVTLEYRVFALESATVKFEHSMIKHEYRRRVCGLCSQVALSSKTLHVAWENYNIALKKSNFASWNLNVVLWNYNVESQSAKLKCELNITRCKLNFGGDITP